MADRTSSPARGSVKSEARGPHWVAWVPDANGRPEDSVVFVAGTREEAEARARELSAAKTRE